MKSILISIRPEWVAKILNGPKTIEIRKTAPKCDFPIDVYIYCTKNRPFVQEEFDDVDFSGRYDYPIGEYATLSNESKLQRYGKPLNGKVVAKFRLRKVEKIDVPYPAYFHEVKDMYQHITEGSLLSLGALHAYLGTDSGYAWHISDLQIFDNPKDLSEFGLARAPQSWQYVEEE